MGSSGSGATITVIVAPTQGVLRYIPFAVNASVGDTIKFMWGANNHTVTKSSELTPCNKTADALFASGTHNKDFVCKFWQCDIQQDLISLVCYSHTGCE
jgi:plastocyanin